MTSIPGHHARRSPAVSDHMREIQELLKTHAKLDAGAIGKHLGISRSRACELMLWMLDHGMVAASTEWPCDARGRPKKRYEARP